VDTNGKAEKQIPKVVLIAKDMIGMGRLRK